MPFSRSNLQLATCKLVTLVTYRYYAHDTQLLFGWLQSLAIAFAIGWLVFDPFVILVRNDLRRHPSATNRLLISHESAINQSRHESAINQVRNNLSCTKRVIKTREYQVAREIRRQPLTRLLAIH